MLKFGLFTWGLLLTGFLAVGAIVAAASLLHDHDPLSWQVTAVDIAESPAGETRLLVKGEELHAGMQALLLPAINAAEIEGEAVDLSVVLYQIATDGRLAVATSRDKRLLTIDVTKGLEPKILGGVGLDHDQSFKRGSITALKLIGARALVCTSTVGLTLVDVSDPTEPQLVDSLQISDRLLDLVSVGERIYIASDTVGLFAVALEDDRLSSRAVPGSRPATRLAVDRSRLVTATYNGELTFYDLDRQGLPKLAGTLNLAFKIRDLAVANGRLFVCTASGKLLEFNLEDWPHPSLAGELDLKGRPLKLEWLESSSQLLATLVGNGVTAIDISRAGKPQPVGKISLSKVPVSVSGHDNRWFMAGLNGLKILSAQTFGVERSSPLITYPFIKDSGKSSLLPWNSALFVYDRRNLRQLSSGRGEGREPVADLSEEVPFLVLPDHDGVRLHAVRHRMPAPEVVGRIPVYDELAVATWENDVDLVKEAFWHADRIYALSPFKLSIFGVDRSGKVFSREHLSFQEPLSDMAWLPGGFLVLATNAPDLKVVDVRRPGAYPVVGSYPFAKHQKAVGFVKKLLVGGRRLYVARARLGVEVYDIADPAAPRLLQRIDTPGSATDLALHDGLLLVADYERGIFIIDVSGERAMTVGSYRLPIICQKIFCNENGLYLTNSANGILQLPPPLRLPAAEFALKEQASLTVPPGVAPGHYHLALYDKQKAASYTVKLQ